MVSQKGEHSHPIGPYWPIKGPVGSATEVQHRTAFVKGYSMPAVGHRHV